MYFADDFVVYDPITFCYFLEGGFAANIEVLDESCKCAVGVIYVGLALPLEVLLLQ